MFEITDNPFYTRRECPSPHAGYTYEPESQHGTTGELRRMNLAVPNGYEDVFRSMAELAVYTDAHARQPRNEEHLRIILDENARHINELTAGCHNAVVMRPDGAPANYNDYNGCMESILELVMHSMRYSIGAARADNERHRQEIELMVRAAQEELRWEEPARTTQEETNDYIIKHEF